MTLEDLMNMWETDSYIDDNHLGEASTATPKLHAKWIQILVQYKLKLSKLNGDYYRLRKNKFRYYRGELSRQELEELGWQQWQGVKPLKNEMDEFLQGDSELIILKQKVEYIQTVIDFLESVVRQINSRNFGIRDGIEWKKFLTGM
jgi:hypothetical protein